MKKFIENWPLEFWSAEAFGGLIMVVMLAYAILTITRTVDDGIQRAGYEHTPQKPSPPANAP